MKRNPKHVLSCDLDSKSPEANSAVEEWCDERGLKHIRTSAKDGTGLDEFYETAVTLALDGLKERQDSEE